MSQIADTFLLGAYRKMATATGSRMVTSLMTTSHDHDVIVMTSQPSTCYFFDSSWQN